MTVVTAAPGAPRGGRALGWLVVACTGLALMFLVGQRVLGARGQGTRAQSEAEDEEFVVSTAAPLAAPSRESDVARSRAEVLTEERPPATSTLTGRLQINGFAARRGRVRLYSEDASFERELVIDGGGRFFCEAVPATPLFATFEADGVFERELVLPDRFEIRPIAGEKTVVDLDWWTRHVNIVVSSEDEVPGPARVRVRGPGYDREVGVDESGLQRLDLVGEGIFTFDTVTPRGLTAQAELELERGDDLDTAVLFARIKNY
jgi:hypothetical protein